MLAFATRIAVMRLGKMVDEKVDPKATSPEQLAELMVGERRLEAPPLKRAAPGEVRLKLDAASRRRGSPASTSRCAGGEILGVAGVDGNGQRELAEVVAGPARAGRRASCALLTASGARTGARTWRAKRAWRTYPRTGCAARWSPTLTVEENVSLGRQDQPPFAKGPLIDFAGRRARTVKLLEAHDVRPREPERRMGDLSGGNQQKLVVARELDAAPKVLVVVQPTRGLDIARGGGGARAPARRTAAPGLRGAARLARPRRGARSCRTGWWCSSRGASPASSPGRPPAPGTSGRWAGACWARRSMA